MAREGTDIQNLFYPRGVAVIGSASEGRLGYELIRQLLHGGYQHVFAVNPKAQGLTLPCPPQGGGQGEGRISIPGYDTVVKIDHPVDMAVIVSPPGTVPSVLEDCGKAGVRAAAIIASGFSEVGNYEAEQEVRAAAERYGVRFIGPNCAGLVNTTHHLYPTLETRPPTGTTSIVAQSGAVGGVLLAWARQYGLGVGKFVSYGNGADLDEIDFLRYLADDPETEAVALYIESTSDGRAFMEAVSACTRRKPVVVIKAGRTRAGKRATLSHTGSMAGADAVYDTALKQCGAIRVQTIEEMFDFCKAFAGVRANSSVPISTGRRIAIVTNSGGPGVLAADRAEEMGLNVAEPSPALREALRGFLPTHCPLKNPIDLTVQGTEEWYRRTLSAVLEEYDAALAINVATPYLDSVALARGVCDAAQDSDRPVLAAFLPEQIVRESVTYLQERGVPNFATGERAVTALAWVAAYHDPARLRRTQSNLRRIGKISDSCPAEFSVEASVEPPPTSSLRVSTPAGLPTCEPEAMAWLRENGIPVPEFRFATTPEEAVRGCREIGYPVAMKVVSPHILHKSDVGGVILDVVNDTAACEAFAALESIAQDKDFRGATIYPMVEGALEVLLGLSRDPQFGPVVAFGLGGIYTEVWHDIALRVAPIDRADAEAMIREIDSFPLLEGIRGEPPRDLDALADALVTFSQLPIRYPAIDEVDLNPVFLFAQGGGLLAADVRMIAKDTLSDKSAADSCQLPVAD
ncbi:MAG: acetate--CoA ligase family protein [Anaerolineae bacterium]|jgi:acetyltransferase